VAVVGGRLGLRLREGGGQSDEKSQRHVKDLPHGFTSSRGAGRHWRNRGRVTIAGSGGLKQVQIDVNGKRFNISGLQDGEKRTIDAGAATVRVSRSLSPPPRHCPGLARVQVTSTKKRPGHGAPGGMAT